MLSTNITRTLLLRVLTCHALSVFRCHLPRKLEMKPCGDSYRRLIFNTGSCQRLYSTTRNREGLGKPKGYMDPKARYILEQQTLSGLPDLSKDFLVLGIETSCDDTGVAIVSSNGTILSNAVYSQYAIHERFGGVVPGLAMDAHKNNIDLALKDALAQAGLSSVHEVDAIAVTKGPGLEICLRVGLRKAQALAMEYKKPFVTVHHLEAHCLIARLAGMEVTQLSSSPSSSISTSDPQQLTDALISKLPPLSLSLLSSSITTDLPRVQYPFLALLVSGGHTSLLVCRGLGDYSVIGATLDDSLGEAFDKAARLLGLRTGGSGGAAVERTALTGKTDAFDIRVPMRDKPNCDFSYAGLKNAFRVAVSNARVEAGLQDGDATNAPAGQMQESPELIVLPETVTADLSATFQAVAFQHVEDRVARAMYYVEREVQRTEEQSKEPLTLVVVGGVAANQDLRRRLLNLLQIANNNIDNKRKEGTNTMTNEGATSTATNDNINMTWRLVCPPPALCTDNGVMAAWAGIEKLFRGISDDCVEQETVSRWPIGTPIERGEGVFKKRDPPPRKTEGMKQ
eukprot:gene6077-12262_t